MAAPVIVKPIPKQIINEQASFGPFDLNDYFQAEGESIKFVAGLSSGSALPRGLICTEDGLFTGIPAKGTNGHYEICITAQNESGSVDAFFEFTIKVSFAADVSADYLSELKSQVWQALDQKLPLPDFAALNDRPVTVADVYYLLERFATLTIWDALNLEGMGKKNLIQLEDASPHFNVYDRGALLVAAPKDLYSSERTTQDALQTARAMAREVYKRGWVIEFAGFDKMERALWVELQHLEDKFGKRLEILRYDPSFKELKIYKEEAKVYASERLENR